MLISKSKFSSVLNLIHNIAVDEEKMGNDIFLSYLSNEYKNLAIKGTNIDHLLKDRVILLNVVHYSKLMDKLKTLNIYFNNLVSRNIYNNTILNQSAFAKIMQYFCPFIIEIGLTTLHYMSGELLRSYGSIDDYPPMVGVTTNKIYPYNMTANRIPYTAIVPFANVTGDGSGKYFMIVRVHRSLAPNSANMSNSDGGVGTINLFKRLYHGKLLSENEVLSTSKYYKYDFEFNGSRLGLILDNIMNKYEYRVLTALDEFLNKDASIYKHVIEKKVIKSSASDIQSIGDILKEDKYIALRSERGESPKQFLV